MPRIKKPATKSKTKRRKPRRAGGLLAPQSKYRDSMCGDAIALMEQGLSLYETANAMGITTDSLRTFEKRVPEFAAAMQIARDKNRAWWDATGRSNLDSKTFNWTGYIFQTCNRFKDMKRGDTIDHKHSGAVKHSGEVKVTFHSAMKEAPPDAVRPDDKSKGS